MKVFILVTCRKLELAHFTKLVFATIRTGFPTAQIILRNNDIQTGVSVSVPGGATVESDMSPTIHHDWIAGLLDRETEPFWICDTDVMFWESVESWEFSGTLAGRLIPEFQDDFSGCLTRSRLHTSLLYFNPDKIKAAISEWRKQVPDTVFTPVAHLVNPLVLPWKKRAIFYDTCSLLYHAVHGQAFTDAQLDCYDHFNFGTIEDVVLPRLKDGAVMAEARARIIANPIAGKGMWRHQEQWYAAHQIPSA